jgi:hypothetical protein
VNILYSGELLGFVSQSKTDRRQLRGGSIVVEQGTICAATSLVVCSNGVKAGQIVTCVIFAHDCDGEAAGAEYEAASFDARVLFGGFGNAMVVDFKKTGLFKASRTAIIAGEGLYSFSVRVVTEDDRLRSRRLGIELDGIHDVSPSSVSVSATSISAEHTQFDCDLSVSAGDLGKCIIHPRDMYGNPTGVVSDVTAFSCAVSTATGNIVDAIVTFVTEGELRAFFNITEAGDATVALQHLGKDVENPSETNAVGTNIKAGSTSNYNSLFSCPLHTIASSNTPCLLRANDIYMNPTSRGLYSNDLSVDIVIDSTSAFADVNFTLDETGVEGEFKVNFAITQIGQAKISMTLFGETLSVFNVQDTITVQAGLLSSEKTLLICPDESTAGSLVMCTIYGRNERGAVEGTAAEVSALVLEIVESDGTEIVSDVVYFSYGVYKIQFQLKRSGNTLVSARYLGSIIGGNSIVIAVVA